MGMDLYKNAVENTGFKADPVGDQFSLDDVYGVVEAVAQFLQTEFKFHLPDGAIDEMFIGCVQGTYQYRIQNEDRLEQGRAWVASLEKKNEDV